MKNKMKELNPNNLQYFLWEKWIIKTEDDLNNLISNPEWKYVLDLVKNWKSENIKLFFGKDWIIKTKEELKRIILNKKWEDIIDLIKYFKFQKIKLFFGKNWIIQTSEELKKIFANKIKWNDIMYLTVYWKLENIKLFFGEKFYNIKNKNDLEELIKKDNWNYISYIIRDCDIKTINLLINKHKINTTMDLENNIQLFAQNIYIRKNSNILKWSYHKKEIKYQSFFNFINQYKWYISNNVYLTEHNEDQFNNFFSQTNLKIENSKLDWEQNRERNHKIWKESYFDINEKSINTKEIQLAVNRLFAPLFPMTRLLKLINGKVNYVSIDVENNEDGIKLNQLKEGTNENINKFFIMIYQFLTIDYDRRENKNLWKKWIIYDHDLMFHTIEYSRFFYNIFDNENNFEEMWNILYMIRDYLTDEVNRLLEYYSKKWENETVFVFKKLRSRLDMLNFSNLIYYNDQDNPEIEKFAKKLDNQYYR